GIVVAARGELSSSRARAPELTLVPPAGPPAAPLFVGSSVAGGAPGRPPAGCGRLDRAAQLRGGGLVCQPFQVTQHDRGAELLGQAADLGLHEMIPVGIDAGASRPDFGRVRGHLDASPLVMAPTGLPRAGAS